MFILFIFYSFLFIVFKDQIVRMEEKLQISREILSYVSTTYLARISIEAAEASNKMNRMMKRYGAFATIFLPLTLMSGLVSLLSFEISKKNNENKKKINWKKL